MSIKKAYEKKFEAQLNEWKTEIDKLKAKVEKAEADAQITYHKQIEGHTSATENCIGKTG